MRVPRVVLLCLSASLVIDGGAAFAQTLASAQRVVGRIDESQLITLKGNTHPAAIGQNDRGPASPDLAMTDVILVLKRSPEQEAAFDQFVASQYDPSSPNFHSWLAPADVGTMFGPSLADVATISAWLRGHGLHVDQVSPDRMTIRFSGSAAQVESAFHVEIHNLLVNGQPHIANMSDPQIPAALAPVVEGVKALHNFFPRPLHQTGALVSLDPSVGGWHRVSGGTEQGASEGLVAKPYFGISVGSGSNAYTIEDVAPYDFATIYNVLPLWNSGTDGTGQTIAIAGTSDINPADVASFRSVFGLPAGTAPTTIVANGTDPGECFSTYQGAACTIDDLTENTLDVEWSGAVAKGANIVLVVSGSNSTTTDTVYSSADYVVQNDTANILSVSYGECELGEGASGNAAYNNLWETAASEGIAVFVAAGDAGAATCDQGLSGNPPHPAQYGLSVSGIASTPYDTAVGGTDLNWGSTASPYWATSNVGNGSNALGYVPEVPWNDTCTNPLALNYLDEWATVLQQHNYGALLPTDADSACNFVSQWWNLIYNNTSPAVDLAPFLDTIGGGGGASNCITGNGENVSSCTGGYAKPSWQSGVPGIPADGARDLPDVSFMAGNGFLGSAYLICVSANGACVSTFYLTNPPTAQEVGGTSVGTPAMAGVMALINQKAGTPQGNPNAELYAMAARQSYGNCTAEFGTTSDGCSFNDIDTGTIAMACASGSPNCTVTYASNSVGVLSGYAATGGFDLATGLGSLNIANVVNAWSNRLGSAGATVTVTPGTNSFPTSQALSVTVTVSGASGTPTGTVGISGGGYAAAATLSGGTATSTFPAYSLFPGNETLTAHYSGDATYARAVSTAGITVTKTDPTIMAQSSLSVVHANSGSDTIAVVVSGTGPAPTGTVTVSINSFVSPTCTLVAGSCTTYFVPVSAFINGTNTVTANYSGDKYYNSGTGSTTLNATILSPTLQLVPSSTNFGAADSITLTVNVSGAGGTPTGTVGLNNLYYDFISLNTGGSVTFNIGPDNLAAGTDTLSVQYEGDATYLPETASTTVTVSLSPTSVTVAPSATSLFTNDSLTLTGSVTSSAGAPGGFVNIYGAEYSVSATVSQGQYGALIPAGWLNVGPDTLTVSYSGDQFYSPASAATTVTVQPFTRLTSSITVTPTMNPVDAGQQLAVTATVLGSGGPATGTTTLTAGSFNSGPLVVSPNPTGGSTTIYVPAYTFGVGTGTLNVSYSGDPTYLPASGTGSVTVSPSSYTISASTPGQPISPGEIATAEISIGSTTGYLGTITATCALTAEPSGAADLPTCTVQNGTVQMTQNFQLGLAQASIATTGPTASLGRPNLSGGDRKWKGAGEIALALLVLLGIPARRRRWRAMLGVLVLLAVFGGLSACGGGGGGGGGGGNSGTTAGTYTFTVTATGNPAMTPAPTTTFTVLVN